MAGILDAVKTVVIVMMENRSFDHMLGHLSLENPASPVKGLKADALANGVYTNDYLDTPYPLYELGEDVELDSDIPHEWPAVATQLHWDGAAATFTMDGFVEAYAQAGNVTNAQCIPMGYFPSRLVPGTDFLAKEFCVCDNWFSPLPASTQPNRTMALCGDSAIATTHLQLIPIGLNIFEWMDDNTHKVRWRVYHDGFSFYTLYDRLLPRVIGPEFRRFNTFHSDMMADPAADDPQVIIVEPCYESAPHFGTQQANDNHAPLAVGHGEDFLRQVYMGVTANAERWGSTVMILCYDEHGGFYDHVPPPSISYKTTGDDPVTFSNLGPRVPGIIVSPFVMPGSVFSGLLDHTSILQFMAEKFGNGAPFSATVEQRREQQIGSISDVLSEQAVRPIPPVPTQTMTVTTVLGKQLTAKPPEPMEQAFANAANQLMAQYPDPANTVYPELKAWKDGQERK